jgi:hypothetical protein
VQLAAGLLTGLGGIFAAADFPPIHGASNKNDQSKTCIDNRTGDEGHEQPANRPFWLTALHTCVQRGSGYCTLRWVMSVWDTLGAVVVASACKPYCQWSPALYLAELSAIPAGSIVSRARCVVSSLRSCQSLTLSILSSWLQAG